MSISSYRNWNLLILLAASLFAITAQAGSKDEKFQLDFRFAPLAQVKNQRFLHLAARLERVEADSDSLFVHSRFAVPVDSSFFESGKYLKPAYLGKILTAKVVRRGDRYLASKQVRFPIGQIDFELEVEHIAAEGFDRASGSTQKLIGQMRKGEDGSRRLKAVSLQTFTRFTNVFDEVRQVIGFFDDGEGRTLVEIDYVAVVNPWIVSRLSLIPFLDTEDLFKDQVVAELRRAQEAL